MTTRKDFKEFDAARAQQGAPYACRDDDYRAEILSWEGRVIIGRARLVDERRQGDWRAVEWDRTGHLYSEPMPHGRDLVLVPGAFCQGRPVYVGDELFAPGGKKFTVAPDDMVDLGYIEVCSWAKWPPVVATRMGAACLEAVRIATPPLVGPLVHVANAALARAVADGDLVPRETLLPLVRGVLAQYQVDADGYALEAIIKSVLESLK